MAQKKSKPASRRQSAARRAKSRPAGSTRAAAKSSARRPQAKVRTQFVTDFVAEFIGKPGNWLWPQSEETRPAVVVDFQTIVNALVQAGYLLTPPVAGTSASLLDRVENFLIAQNWPLSAPIPKQWQGIEPTIRLIEVSQIVDHLLEAINANGPCIKKGSTTKWPPH